MLTCWRKSKERLREWQKKRDLSVFYDCHLVDYNYKSAGLFMKVPSNGMRCSGYKWEHRKLQLVQMLCFLIVGEVKYQKRHPEGALESPCLEIFDASADKTLSKLSWMEQC